MSSRPKCRHVEARKKKNVTTCPIFGFRLLEPPAPVILSALGLREGLDGARFREGKARAATCP